jgi:hypothetical protein
MVCVLPTALNLASWSFGSGGTTGNDYNRGLGVGIPFTGHWLPISLPAGQVAQVQWDAPGRICSVLYGDGCHDVTVTGGVDPGLIDASGVFVVSGNPKIGNTYFEDAPEETVTPVVQITETAEAQLSATAQALTPTVANEATVIVLPTYTPTGAATAVATATSAVPTPTFTATIDGNATAYAHFTQTAVAALTRTAVANATQTAVVALTLTPAAALTLTAVVVRTSTAAAALTGTAVVHATETGVAQSAGTQIAQATGTAAARLTGTAVVHLTETAVVEATETAAAFATSTAVVYATQTAAVIATATAFAPGPCGSFDSLISGLHSVDCSVQAIPTQIAGEFIPTKDIPVQLSAWRDDMDSRFPLAAMSIIHDCVSPLFGSGTDDLVITLPGLGLGNFEMRVTAGAMGGLTLIVSRIAAGLMGAFYLWSIARRFLGLGGSE